MTDMKINQRGIVETQLFLLGDSKWREVSDYERNEAIALLCELLRVEIWRTNATKHGDVQLELRPATS